MNLDHQAIRDEIQRQNIQMELLLIVQLVTLLQQSLTNAHQVLHYRH